MNKTLILVNILALFLTSCSNFRSSETERVPAAASSGESCTDIVKNIMTDNRPVSYEEKIKSSLKIDLSAEELEDFMIAYNDTNLADRHLQTIRSIMLYAKEDRAVRKDLLKEFDEQIHGRAEDMTNANWKKFAAHKKKVDNKKLKMKSPEKAEIYEKLYYSCKTQIKGAPTADAIRNSKRLTYALMAGGLSATTASYVGVHWEEEKNQKWFNELYFTLGIGIVFSFIGSKLVLANPKLDPWKGKMPLAFLNNALSDAGVSGAYYFMFRTKDSELQNKLDQLEKDPEAQKKLQELMVIAEENHLFEKHQKATQDMFKDKKTGKSVEAKDFDHEITMDDVDLEGSRDVLLDALAQQEYQEKSGLMKTGYPAVDRFSYHRIYNLFSVPTNIGMTILMHNQMCMTEDPKKGFMKAVGLYMGASLLMDALYFKGKKELINQ